jgi:hypothetical protein
MLQPAEAHGHVERRRELGHGVPGDSFSRMDLLLFPGARRIHTCVRITGD